MINIPILKLEAMPCYAQGLACYAISCGRRYEMLFAGSWGFEYRESASAHKVGERVKDRAILKLNYFKRYHGIEVSIKEVNEGENFIDILENQLNQNHPVIIYVSSYYFPWNDHYKTFENRTLHAITVVDMNREKQVIYCTDNMYGQQKAELSFEDFKAGNNGKYWILKCLDQYEKEVDIDEVIAYALSKLKRNSLELKDIPDIRRLADALRNNFDLKKEIDNMEGGIWVKPLIFNIGGVMADREDFTMLLEFLLEQKEDVNLRLAKDKMADIALRWNQIRGLLLKGAFLEEPSKLVERVAKRIDKVADLEEETYHLLEDWKESVPACEQTEEDNEPDISEIVPVRLDEYFDLQTFGIHQDVESIVTINEMRYYFYVAESMEKEWFELRQMKFFHPLMSGKENDSLKCNGQEILVKPDTYDSIMLLGYGDLSSYNDELELLYADGTQETIAVEMPDASIPNPKIKNSLLWTGQCGFIDDIEEHAWDVGLYGKVYPIKQKLLHSIKLPICPNLVFLAISLGKGKKR